MMGLNDSAYWISWMLYYFIINTIISIFSVIILSINVFKATNKLIIFFYFWCYGISLFGYVIFT